MLLAAASEPVPQPSRSRARVTAPAAGSVARSRGSAPGMSEARLHPPQEAGTGPKGPARQDDRHGPAGEDEPLVNGPGREGQLGRAVVEDRGRHRIALSGRGFHRPGQTAQVAGPRLTLVHPGHEVGEALGLHGLEGEGVERGLGSAAVGRPHRRAQGLAAQPVRRSLVGQDAARGRPRARSRPARRLRRRSIPCRPAPPGPGAPGAPATSAMTASFTTRTRSRWPRRRRIPRMTASSWGRSTPAMPRHKAADLAAGRGPLDHVVKHLLDLELAVGVEVRSPASRLPRGRRRPPPPRAPRSWCPPASRPRT